MICKQPDNNPSLSYIHAYIMCIRNNSYKYNYNLLLGHIFESGYMVMWPSDKL